MRRFAAPLPLGAMLVVSGCGHSPATTFLVIDPAPATAPRTTYAGPLLRVPFLHLPVTIDRPELTRRDAAGTLKVEDFARWSAPLGLMARNALIQDLTARLPAGSVLPPDAAAAPREIRIEATVLDATFGTGDATLLVSYRLVLPGKTEARPIIIRLTAPISGETPPSRAQAWSSLIGQLADSIVARL